MRSFLYFAGALALAWGLALPAVAAPDAPGVMRDITAAEMAKDMSPGWNLGNTLEALPGETSWGNPPASQELFDALKAAGFKSVRIPVSWYSHASSSGTIDEAWMERVVEVVGYARKAGLYVVLNEHWDGGWLLPSADKKEEADARLAKLWSQIALRFKDYDDYLLFAGTNEVHLENQYDAPSAENSAVQNGFNQVFVDAVRATGGNNAKRVLIVQGYNTNIQYTVDNLVLPVDPTANRLMVEVHFYDPYNFSLNDKSSHWQWGAIATQKESVESWANEAYVDTLFDKLKVRFVDKGVPVILGEYSAIARGEYREHERYRVYWDAYVTRAAFKRGIVPFYWDSGSIGNHASGLFNRRTGSLVHAHIVEAILKMTK